MYLYYYFLKKMFLLVPPLLNLRGGFLFLINLMVNLMFNLVSKKQILNDYCLSSKDIGSSKIQIILLTFRINKLKYHFSFHKKDFHNKRGLLKLIFRRRKLLDYLRIYDFNEFNYLKKELQLRN